MHSEFTFQSFDNLTLFGQAWIPEHSKAVVMLVHGIGEHSGRYAKLAEDFNKQKIALIAFDQRGHGQSAGKKGHTPSLEAWMKDIENFIQKAKMEIKNQANTSNLKWFLYGHSLGGIEVLNYILKRQPKIDGAIVTSPAIELAFKPSAVKVLAGQIANLILPSITLHNELELKYLSHDQRVVEAYQNDPLVHDWISARTYASMTEAGQYALAHAAQLNIPLLLMHGSEDHMTSATASAKFTKSAGDKCHFKLWEGMYHELHNELERGEVIEYIITTALLHK